MPVLPPVLIRSGGTIAMTALLAACGSQISTTASAPALVPLSLDVGNLGSVKSATLKAQGVPFNDDGTSAVQSVHVKVYEEYNTGGSGIPLRFDADGNQTPNGSRNYVELTPDQTTTEIRLAPGTYDFEATGLTATTSGVALAYDLQSDRTINATGGPSEDTVTFKLRTLVGQVSLEPVLPVTYVLPGQILDLNLVVQTPQIAGGRRYAVPLADYSFSEATGSETRGVSVQETSSLGERIQILPPENNATDIHLYQRLQGLATPNPTLATFGVTFSRPYYSTTGLGVDLERPTLIASAQEYRGHLFITFDTSDNVGVARVQIYEGVRLVGSTDDLQSPFGEFFGAMAYTGGDPSVPHDYTVVTQDTSGNETRLQVHADVVPPYTPGMP
ncbi:hypothetical protein [Deinococcus yunweiensis]|uniref:hypothetical protein n=1 Tax=Deinococcus yunweiensis TaxID=367282 RepID=UPI00398EBE7A